MIVKAGIRLWHRIDSGCHKMSRDWQRGPSLLPNKLLPNGSGMSVVEIVVEIIKVESTHFNRGWNHSAIFVFSNITRFRKILSRLTFGGRTVQNVDQIRCPGVPDYDCTVECLQSFIFPLLTIDIAIIITTIAFLSQTCVHLNRAQRTNTFEPYRWLKMG